jgi:aminoglycoside phosphotransferase
MPKFIISEQDIINVLAKNNLVLKNYSLFYEKGLGLVNTIYFITTVNNKKLILKIINPSKIFKEKKTTNEVEIINFLTKNTTIPVPKIIDYSTNTNLIGYEYILMTQIKGEPLSKKYDYISSIQRIKYIKTIANYVVQMNQFKFDKIGQFSNDMKLTKMVNTNKGPFNDFSKYIYYGTKFYLKNVDSSKFKKQIELINEFNEKKVKLTKLILPYTLCHFDLAPHNIMVHNNKITGVIDFEWSGSGSFYVELLNLFEDLKLNKYKNCKIEFFNILKKNNIDIRVPNKVRVYSNIMYYALYLSIYKDVFKTDKELNKFIKKISLYVKKQI